ncbi:MAG TPA: tRNA dimethylallyltransferase, partial [Acidimicrobiales bacterium]|nr:tRNA dimethylallyltransferase [Acidimicrobiales bacterium]
LAVLTNQPARPTRLVGIRDPSEEMSVGEYAALAHAAIDEVAAAHGVAVVAGGTGLYLRAVIDDLRLPGRWPALRSELEADPDTAGLYRRLVGLDPLAASRMEPGNRRRIVRALEVTLGSGRPFSGFGPGLESYPPTRYRLVGLRLARPELDRRIEQRLAAMAAGGLVEEVRALVERHPGGLSRTAGQALGYREVLRHVVDGEPLEERVAEAVRRTRRFARRQEAWFGRDPRITWYDAADNPLAVAERVLGDWSSRCRR